METETARVDLTNLIAGLADNKYFLGRRYAEWCTGAPTLESAVAAAAMAQDEIGHARSLYPLLQDLLGVSPETEPETRTRFEVAAFLREPFKGWTDFVAANFIFDTALTVVLNAAKGSSLGALGQRARRIGEEEILHWLHGEGWTRRLARSGPGVRDEFSRSLARARAGAVGWFDVAVPSLETDGILDAGRAELLEQYRDRVNPVLDGVDLEPV